jgi:hypothetical protein
MDHVKMAARAAKQLLGNLVLLGVRSDRPDSSCGLNRARRTRGTRSVDSGLLGVRLFGKTEFGPAHR